MINTRRDKIYVGFSPVDRPRAKQICRLLHSEGFEVLPAEHDGSSARKHKRNVQRLEQSHVVVTLVSPEALNSPHIWREVAMANTLKLPLVPLVVEPVPHEVPMVGAFDATMRDENFYRAALISRLRRSRVSKSKHVEQTSTQLMRELEQRENRKLRRLGFRVPNRRKNTGNTQLRIALATATLVVAALGLVMQFAI